MKLTFSALLTALLITLSLSSFAESTRYVSEELEITMRSGQGVKFGIKRMLTSGTKLSVIEKNESGYSKVRTEGGAEGWVLTRYLSNTPSSKNKLIASDQKVANLELDLAQHKEELKSLSEQSANTSMENTSLSETTQRLTKELAELRRTAANAIALTDENRLLSERLQQIEHDMQTITIENSKLKSNDTRNWFLIGAAVLFSGIVLGLILPRMRVRKKDSW